jgi:hypothetical protein
MVLNFSKHLAVFWKTKRFSNSRAVSVTATSCRRATGTSSSESSLGLRDLILFLDRVVVNGACICTSSTNESRVLPLSNSICIHALYRERGYLRSRWELLRGA